MEKRLSNNRYMFSYNLTTLQHNGAAFGMLQNAATTTLLAKFKKFSVIENGPVEDRFDVIIYMYNSEKDLPEKYRQFSTYDAEEVQKSREISLGMLPNAA